MSPVTVSPLSQRRVDLVPSVPGQIEAVCPVSLAIELGIEPGDRIVGINGLPLVDALDFQFQAQAEHVVLDVERAGVLLRYDLELEGDEFWGVTFADPTFDGVRICENACPFCFIKQIPKGMRRSLYVLDDDYRYSMLYGSFVTLTNLTEEDWRRIMDDLARLERAGIDFHAQLVLVPGVNDGPYLDRSLSDLATFGSRLRSIAGVPVGLSRHGKERQSRQLRLSRTCMRTLPGKHIAVRRYHPDEALTVISQAASWQARFEQELGDPFFYLGDEFYLMTGTPVPDAAHYGGFPQIEDGIGITRHFIDAADSFLRRSKPNGLIGQRGTVACGELIAPTMRAAVERFNARTGAVLDTVAVENVYLCKEINVSGLLSGQDLMAAFAHRPATEPLYISDRMISQRTGTLLDDMTIEEVERALGRPVVPAADLSDVARDLRTRSRRQALVAALRPA